MALPGMNKVCQKMGGISPKWANFDRDDKPHNFGWFIFTHTHMGGSKNGRSQNHGLQY